MIVLNDVTRLKKLENIRSEFVANVSHEIRTPLTAIRAAAEILLDDTSKSQEEADNFIRIISRHTGRLSAIVEDILSLSILEHGEDHGGAAFTENSVADIVASAAELCMEKAAAKNIEIVRDCEGALRADFDFPLIEQALVNIIDNAVKYSAEKSGVRIRGWTMGEMVFISVSDEGCGIPEEHLPRLLERFYRADKARSRKAGGTGLGLSIVKHIAAVHGGRAEVESKVGKGSTFTISFPKKCNPSGTP